MIPHEVIRQIRRLQLKARRAVESLLGGEYHSVFKGTGIAFDEVREYQPGDDIRSIDWNVTARMGHPFVKRFIEERELTVMLLVDVSGSQQFGTLLQQKREVAAELAAVLAFSAVSNNDRVGLIQFTDQVERFVPPRKGTRHVLRLIRDVLFFQPQRRGTSLREGLDFLNRVLRRRVIVFLLSDFLDSGFERPTSVPAAVTILSLCASPTHARKRCRRWAWCRWRIPRRGSGCCSTPAVGRCASTTSRKPGDGVTAWCNWRVPPAPT